MNSGLDTRNLILAAAFAGLILIGWQYFYERPRQAQYNAYVAAKTEQQKKAAAAKAPVTETAESIVPRAQALEGAPRLRIQSPTLHGSINLKGARFDDLTLVKYRETVDPASPEVVLLSPSRSKELYFAEFGWTAIDGLKLPDRDTVWKADKDLLKPGETVTLSWENGEGLSFSMQVTLDEHYLFTITRKVENRSGGEVTITPYGRILRNVPAKLEAMAILHEGPLGVFDGTLSESTYHDIAESGKQHFSGKQGWLGITDKYWLTALVPSPETTFSATFSHLSQGEQSRLQTDFSDAPATLPPGESHVLTDRLFAGAKEIPVLDGYAKNYSITLFDRAVDYGWLYFLTKPLFFMPNFLNQHIGNFGVAILALTVLVKLLMFPLANKSYKATSKMKVLSPEINRIRERHGGDPMKMNTEMMALYKKYGVNPASGCLPILIQLPVFFALYKVLYVSLEMRHAPFFGWIKDLSAPDPLHLLNGFGLLPHLTHPAWLSFLAIGLWPIIMCITTVIQQRMGPQPTDPVQEKVFKFMPYFFLFLFSSFPAGLVIYWAWSNALSILQQWTINRMHGDAKPVRASA
ncbi:MAG: membrane protein insertase YidC [Alphaproteobacteria bacterium]|nr:membrane protein insertase YidC [Alphaproteobacteria bacterium]